MRTGDTEDGGDGEDERNEEDGEVIFLMPHALCPMPNYLSQ
ncbi:hypothetical protein [Trichormus azollae]